MDGCLCLCLALLTRVSTPGVPRLTLPQHLQRLYKAADVGWLACFVSDRQFPLGELVAQVTDDCSKGGLEIVGRDQRRSDILKREDGMVVRLVRIRVDPIGGDPGCAKVIGVERPRWLPVGMVRPPRGSSVRSRRPWPARDRR
jgi:hypothetical protein